MNYRHTFHAGNHADVLKHVVLLALLEALARKDAAFFALDTHAGRGRYALSSGESARTGEAASGIGRLLVPGPEQRAGIEGPLAPERLVPVAPSPSPAQPPQAIARYLDAVRACSPDDGTSVYPGSPLLIANAMRPQDRLACCELRPEEAAALKALFAADARVAVHARDGYAALKALLPPRQGGQRYARGLVLIDPPYETQEAELGTALAALRDALARWPQAAYALWYPIKRRRTLRTFYRAAAALDCKAALAAELLVRPDDSPLRLNGSGMLLLNPPWRLDMALASTLPWLARVLGEAGASWRLEWLRREGA